MSSKQSDIKTDSGTTGWDCPPLYLEPQICLGFYPFLPRCFCYDCCLVTLYFDIFQTQYTVFLTKIFKTLWKIPYFKGSLHLRICPHLSLLPLFPLRGVTFASLSPTFQEPFFCICNWFLEPKQPSWLTSTTFNLETFTYTLKNKNETKIK